jgi:carbon monoxide dehydrogenase subunit G
VVTSDIEIASRNFEVEASQMRIWRLLGKVIFSCLPGMEEIEVADETSFRAIQRTRVAFMEVKMRLKGKIIDITPPHSLAVSLDLEALRGLIVMRQRVTIRVAAVMPERTEVRCRAVLNASSGLPGWLIVGQARPFVKQMFEAMEKRMRYIVAA